MYHEVSNNYNIIIIKIRRQPYFESTIYQPDPFCQFNHSIRSDFNNTDCDLCRLWNKFQRRETRHHRFLSRLLDFAKPDKIPTVKSTVCLWPPFQHVCRQILSCIYINIRAPVSQ